MPSIACDPAEARPSAGRPEPSRAAAHRDRRADPPGMARRGRGARREESLIRLRAYEKPGDRTPGRGIPMRRPSCDVVRGAKKAQPWKHLIGSVSSALRGTAAAPAPTADRRARAAARRAALDAVTRRAGAGAVTPARRRTAGALARDGLGADLGSAADHGRRRRLALRRPAPVQGVASGLVRPGRPRGPEGALSPGRVAWCGGAVGLSLTQRPAPRSLHAREHTHLSRQKPRSTDTHRERRARIPVTCPASQLRHGEPPFLFRWSELFSCLLTARSSAAYLR